MTEKLGKIKNARFGNGGYQDAMVGISFDLESDGWSVGDFWGYWSTEISSYTKWTEADRVKSLGETVMRINKLLTDAKKPTVDKLAGTPIRCVFDGNLLKSWTVLTEVL